MIEVDAALVLIAGALLLGVCVGVWFGWRLHITQVQIDTELTRARYAETLIAFPGPRTP